MKTWKARFNSEVSELEDIRRYMEGAARMFLSQVPSFGDKPLLNTDEIAKLAKWIVEGEKTSLLMIGATGCGKTILAKALGRTLAVRNNCPYFVSMVKLANMARKYEELPEFVYEDRILILDDLGIEPAEIMMYGNRYQLFNEIIYSRYAHHQPTIITTNCNWEALQEKYEGRVTSRMKEMFDTLIFRGGDLRK